MRGRTGEKVEKVKNKKIIQKLVLTPMCNTARAYQGVRAADVCAAACA